MIKILACMGENAAFVLKAEGHANAERNEKDHDLVCCAVSTLVCTLANSCAMVEDVNTTYRQESGNALLTVDKITKERRQEIAIRFRMAADGLQGLQEQYPDSLRVTIK